MKKLNFLQEKDKKYSKYSLGTKQKLGIAQVLMEDPKIMIFDEPFNGVDFEGVGLLYEIVQDLKKQQKIILVSSHIIETLFNTCDKIAILENKGISKIISKDNFTNLANEYY